MNLSTKQYHYCLQRLKLPPYGLATGVALGLRPRQLARLASGTVKPTAMLSLLLRAYLHNGIAPVKAAEIDDDTSQ
jgi:hypothetical protein